MFRMFAKILMFSAGVMTFTLLAMLIAILCEETRTFSFVGSVTCMIFCASLAISGFAAFMKGAEFDED